MKKRILSFMMAGLLLISAMPVTASPAIGETKIKTTVEEGSHALEESSSEVKESSSEQTSEVLTEEAETEKETEKVAETEEVVEKETEEVETEEISSVITSFAPLEEEVQFQIVSARTEKEKLILPNTLKAIVENKEVIVENIQWECNDTEYQKIEYDSNEGAYLFTPILPDHYTVDNNVELPEIAVMVGMPSINRMAIEDWNNNWVKVYPENNQHDTIWDQQTGSGEVSQDIVGDETHSPVFIRFNNAKTEIGIRLRINTIDGTESTPQFKNFAFIGVDANCNGTVDFFLGIYNPTGNGRLGVYSANPSSLNIGPNNTGISGKPLLSFQPIKGDNYALTKADTFFQSPSVPTGGKQDYFLDYRFKLDDIGNALAGTGKTKENVTFTKDTAFRFITGTAAQDNSFNQDISGMGKDGWKGDSTWPDLGVFSPVVSVEGGFGGYNAVTFDKNTGDTNASPAVSVVKTGEALGALPSTLPTKRGMYFQEWNTQPNGSGETITTSTVITKDTIAYAIWSNKPLYTVTFNTNGGTWTDGSSVDKTIPSNNGVMGDNMPVDPIKSGSFFMGWVTATNIKAADFDGGTAVTSNITVYALWSSTNTTVKVSFYDNTTPLGGKIIATGFPNNGGQGVTAPTPTRVGYTFDGWYKEIACTTKVIDYKGLKADLNVYAKWTPTSYTVTYNPNTGTLTDSASKTITDGFFGSLPSDPTKTGYTFVEWNKLANGTGEPMYPTSQIEGNLTVYAIWQQDIEITFNANGGTFETGAPTTIDVLNQKLNTQPIPPTKESNTFLGWSESVGSNTLIDIMGSNFTSNKTLYAVWTPIYQVKFNPNNGAWNDASTAEIAVDTAYGNVMYLPVEPLRNEYAFSGWNSSADGSGTAFSASTEVTKEKTVYAQWKSTASSFTVSFKEADGSNLGIADETVPAGSIISAPSVPSKTGYDFAGWYKESSLSNQWNFASDTVNQNTSLYAKWTPKSFTANLEYNGADSGNTQTVINLIYNAAYGTLPLPGKTGYTFDGWYEDTSFIQKVTESTVFNKTSNVTIYAKWTPNGYLITAKPYYKNHGASYIEGTNGGTVSGGGTIAYGSSTTLRATADANYDFIGWFDNPNGTGVAKTTALDYTFTVDSAVTYYALFVQKIGEFGVKATGFEGEYDGLDHSIKVELSGDAIGGNVAYAKTVGTYDTVNPGYKNVGEYTVYYKVSKAGFSDVTGSAIVKITPKKLIPKVKDNSVSDKMYDGNKTQTGGSLEVDGLIAGESITVNGKIEFTDANVGVDKAVNVTEITIGGSTASNYLLSTDTLLNQSTTADIKPAKIEGVIVNPTIKNFDGIKTDGVEVKGTKPGDEIQYSTDGINWSKNMPQIEAVGETPIWVKVSRDNHEDLIIGPETAKVKGVPIAFIDVPLFSAGNSNEVRVTGAVTETTAAIKEQSFAIRKSGTNVWKALNAGTSVGKITNYQQIITGLESDTEYELCLQAKDVEENQVETTKKFKTPSKTPPTGEITGEVEQETPDGSLITVTIEMGNIVVGSKKGLTSGDEFTFSNLPDGEYNVVANCNGNYVTQMVTVKDGKTVTIKTMVIGTKLTAVKINGNAPPIAADGMNDLFITNTYLGDTDATNTVTNGGTVEIRLTADELKYPQDKKDIEATMGKQTMGQILDLSLGMYMTSKSGSTTIKSLKTVEGLIEVAIPMSANIVGKEGYQAFRHHNGRVEQLRKLAEGETPVEGTFRVKGNYWYVYSQKFSTYALTYKVKEQDSGNAGGSGNGNNGGSNQPIPPQYYTITIDNNAGGTITPNQKKVIVQAGNSAGFSIAPEKGYLIKEVKVDGKNVGAVSSYLFLNVQANHSLSVNFEISQQSLPVLPTVPKKPQEEGNKTPNKEVSEVEMSSKEPTSSESKKNNALDDIKDRVKEELKDQYEERIQNLPKNLTEEERDEAIRELTQIYEKALADIDKAETAQDISDIYNQTIWQFDGVINNYKNKIEEVKQVLTKDPFIVISALLALLSLAFVLFSLRKNKTNKQRILVILFAILSILIFFLTTGWKGFAWVNFWTLIVAVFTVLSGVLAFRKAEEEEEDEEDEEEASY